MEFSYLQEQDHQDRETGLHSEGAVLEIQLPRGRDVPDRGTCARKRSSQYRGVTKHRRSGRWEAHIWIKEIGRQIYLGGYEKEEHAAEAYDVAAIKCKGKKVKTNFDESRYSDLTECMSNISLEELIMAVRRQSQGFSRGTSSFRGVTLHPSGRFESRIGIPGSKHIYLGLYRDEQEAARAYDQALVRLRGSSASTNFALSDYRTELAEYHRMQRLMLTGDDVWEENMHGVSYERWIKFGGADECLLGRGDGSADLDDETGAAGPGPAALRSSARKATFGLGNTGARGSPGSISLTTPDIPRRPPGRYAPQSLALQHAAGWLVAGACEGGSSFSGNEHKRPTSSSAGLSPDAVNALLEAGFALKGPRKQRKQRSDLGQPAPRALGGDAVGQALPAVGAP